MHLAFARRGTEGAGVDLSAALGDAGELGGGRGQRLETDEPGAGPAGARENGKLPLVGADIDDGGEGVASERDRVLDRRGHAVAQGAPITRVPDQRGEFCEFGRHGAVPVGDAALGVRSEHGSGVREGGCTVFGAFDVGKRAVPPTHQQPIQEWVSRSRAR